MHRLGIEDSMSTYELHPFLHPQWVMSHRGAMKKGHSRILTLRVRYWG
jgi:hypothetical protein